MIRKKIEKKYAKALFDILISEKEYEKNYTQLMQLNSFFKSETEIFEFLCNPINNLANKTDIVRKMIDMLTLMPLNVKFLNIVIKKHVLVYFSGIVEELEKLYNDFKGVIHVEVTTTIPLTEPIKLKLLKSMEELTGKRVLMSHKIDESIIGGIIARINSVIYDGSIKRQLELIKANVVKER